MSSIVIGLISICLGLWGLSKFWWYVVDVLAAVLPLLLILGGAVAVMAGIRNSGLKVKNREESRDEETE